MAGIFEEPSDTSAILTLSHDLAQTLMAEFTAAPIAGTASVIAIIAGIYAAGRFISNARARKRAKAILADFKPAELINRRKVSGRDMAVAELRAALVQTGKGAVVPVRTGIGGIGKTTLAKYYAKVHAADYDRIEFLRAGTEQELMVDLAALAKRLLPGLDEADGVRPLALHARDQITELASQKKWLLIFDNVEAPQLMLDWVMRARHLHVLVTSRFPDWQADGFEARPLDLLDDTAALAVLRNEAGRDDPGLADLARDLGNLPLALVQAGEWLRANPRATAQEFSAQVDRLRERIDIPGITTQRDRTTAAVVEMTLAQLGKDARALVDIMAWLAPDRIAEDIFARLNDVPWLIRLWHPFARRIPMRVWRVARDATRLSAAMAELRTAALLEDDPEVPGRYRMHRVFQRVVRAPVGRRGAPRFDAAKSAAALLAAQFPGDPNLERTWQDYRRLLPHVQALWSAAEPLWHTAWGKPGWAAMDYLLGQSGIFLSKQHDRAGAVALGRASLALTEARLGEADRDIPLALGNLALELANLGEFAEAQDKIDRAVALDEAHRKGAERADVAGIYMQQASLGFRRMEAGGKVAEGAEAMAEAALDKARGILAELFGEDSAKMSNWWNQMGYLRRLQGRKGAQLQAMKRALEICRALPQADRGELAMRAMNYGATLLELGRAEEAQGALREAYGIDAEIFEAVPDHPSLRASAQWLTACLLVLARKGQESRDEAAAICARHGVDLAEEEAIAARYPLDPVVVEDEGEAE